MVFFTLLMRFMQKLTNSPSVCSKMWKWSRLSVLPEASAKSVHLFMLQSRNQRSMEPGIAPQMGNITSLVLVWGEFLELSPKRLPGWRMNKNIGKNTQNCDPVGLTLWPTVGQIGLGNSPGADNIYDAVHFLWKAFAIYDFFISTALTRAPKVREHIDSSVESGPLFWDSSEDLQKDFFSPKKRELNRDSFCPKISISYTFSWKIYTLWYCHLCSQMTPGYSSKGLWNTVFHDPLRASNWPGSWGLANQICCCCLVKSTKKSVSCARKRSVLYVTCARVDLKQHQCLGVAS